MVFFSRDTIWRDTSGRIGVWREFLGSKNNIFSCWDNPVRQNVNFFLFNNSGRGIIMTYGKEFAHFGKKLFNLARWDWPRQGKIWRNSWSVCPGEKKFRNFPRRELAPPQTLPNRRDLEPYMSHVGVTWGKSLEQAKNGWRRSGKSSLLGNSILIQKSSSSWWASAELNFGVRHSLLGTKFLSCYI